MTQQNIEKNDSNPDASEKNLCLGTRYQPTWKFVWNQYLQEPLRSQVHPRWLFWIVHGRRNLLYVHPSDDLDFRSDIAIQFKCLLSFDLFDIDLSTIAAILWHKIFETWWELSGEGSIVPLQRELHETANMLGLCRQWSRNRTNRSWCVSFVVGQKSFHVLRPTSWQCPGILESRSQASS